METLAPDKDPEKPQGERELRTGPEPEKMGKTAYERSDILKSIFSSSPDGIVVTDLDGKVIECNHAAAKLYGNTTPQELIGKPIVEFISAEEKGHLNEVIKKSTGNFPLTNLEYAIRNQAGSNISVLLSVDLLKGTSGNTIGYVAVVKDISERKKVEAALRRAQIRTSTILEGIADTFYSLDSEWRFTLVNPAAEKAPFGRPASELLGKVIWDLYPNLVGTPIHKHFLEAREKRSIEHYEAQSPLNKRWYEVFMQGRTDGIDVYMRDITERKAVEEKYRNLVKYAPAAIYEMNLEGTKFFSVNDVMCDIVGYSREELLSMKPSELLDQESRSLFGDRIKRKLAGEKIDETIEYRVRKKDGEWIYVDVNVGAFNFTNEKIPSVAVIGHDITERKKAEEALNTANKRLALAQKSAGAGIWDWDIITGKLEWSPEMFELFGLDPSEHKMSFESWRKIIHPEDLKTAEENINKSVKDKTNLVNTYRIILPSGEVRWIEALGNAAYDESGKALRMSGICIDVTARKKTEEALLESERRFRDIVESMDEYAWEIDTSGVFTYVSPAVERVLGYSPEEITNKSLLDLWDSSKKEEQTQKAYEILASQKPFKGFVNFNIHRDGRTVIVESSGVPLFDSAGKLTGYRGIDRDITERQHFLEALKVSETRFRRLFETALDGILILDAITGQIDEVNPFLEDMLGYSHEEFLGKKLWEIGPFKDTKLSKDAFKELQEKGNIRYEDLPLETKDGRKINVEFVSNIYTVDHKNVIQCNIRDITERRIASEKMEHLASFPRLDPNPVLEVDMQGTITFANPAVKEILKDVGLDDDAKHFLPTDFDNILEEFRNGKYSPFLHREIKVGDRIFGQSIYPSKSLNAIRIYAFDITHRKIAEDELSKSNKRNEILSYTSASLLESESPQLLVEDLCGKVLKFLDCQVFFNFLVDESVGRLHLNAYKGIPKERAKEIEWLEYGEAVCGCAAKEGCRIIAEKIQDTDDPRTTLVKSFGVRAYACQPLMEGSKVIGTLSFGTKSRDAFSKEDIEMMRAVSDQVSIAMSRIRSREEILKEKDNLQTIFDVVEVGMLLIDENGKVERVNNMISKWVGKDLSNCGNTQPGDILGCIHAVTDSSGCGNTKHCVKCPIRNAFESVLKSGKFIHDVEIESTLMIGGKESILWLETSVDPIILDGRRHALLSIEDITERKNKEKELIKLNRTLKAVSDSNQALMNATDETKYMERICQIAVKDCGYQMVWIGFAQNDENKSVKPVAYAGFDEGYLNSLNITWADNERGRGPTGTAIRTGTTRICTDMLSDPNFKPWREEATKRGYASSLSIPLIAYGKVLGALMIYSKEPNSFSREEVELLTELANDLSYGIMTIRIRNEHRKAEEELRETKDYLENLFNYANAPIVCWDPNFRITRFNHAFEYMSFYTSEEVLGEELSILFPEPAREEILEKINMTLTGEKWEVVEIPIRRKDGNIRIALWNSANIYSDDGKTLIATIAQGQDITERKAAEVEVKASLKEKEELLKEVHHRVKNNLQVISSLLSLQSKYIRDEETADLFKQSQSRIQSIALIHEKLYQAGDFTKIDFNRYVADLTNNLLRTYGMGRIKANIDIKEVLLNIEYAIPCGLIINEMFTNSLKHAFPGGRDGNINISMRKTGDDVELLVADDGTGMRGIDPRNSKTLGMQLLTNIVEKQLEGKISLDARRGTRFKVTFKVE